MFQPLFILSHCSFKLGSVSKSVGTQSGGGRLSLPRHGVTAHSSLRVFPPREKGQNPSFLSAFRWELVIRPGRLLEEARRPQRRAGRSVRAQLGSSASFHVKLKTSPLCGQLHMVFFGETVFLFVCYCTGRLVRLVQ